MISFINYQAWRSGKSFERRAPQSMQRWNANTWRWGQVCQGAKMRWSSCDWCPRAVEHTVKGQTIRTKDVQEIKMRAEEKCRRKCAMFIAYCSAVAS